ncbi:MAG: hypothetical protein H8E27_08020 [Verrucomicrobia subdivision 3 bacterium]|nr:hypothetical protein [Limisphaerales bacterium]
MKTKLVLILSAGAIIAGCGTPVAKQAAAANNSKFVALGTLVGRTVKCTAMQETQLTDGRLQVRANILNLINKRVDLQVSCAFKDEQGFAIDTTPFQTLILDEIAEETVEFKSLNAKAKDYTVRVRLAR